MTIEQKGPGGVSNAFGQRIAKQPSQFTSSVNKNIYVEYANNIPNKLGYQLALAQNNRAVKAPIGAELIVAASQPSMTWGLVCQIDIPFDGVRPIIMHSDTNAITGVLVAAASGPDFIGDKHGSSLTWTNGTFGGSASGTLAAGSAQRPSVTVSDMMQVASVPRTDGGKGYIAYVRIYLPTGGTGAQSLNQSADYTQLTGLDVGAWYSERTAGDFVTTKAGFGSAMPGRSDSPIWGLEFLCRGKVVSVVEFGDSITRGQTTLAYKNKNFGERATQSVSLLKDNVAFENANAGWSSQTSAQYLARAQDFLAVIKPTVAVYAAFSPNDHAGSPTGITQANIDLEKFRVGQFIETCRINNVVPVLWTGLPAGSSKTWNSTSDDLRKAYNAELKNLYGKTVLVMDFDSVISDGLSPANFISGYSNDGLHPNDTGQEVMGTKMVTDLLFAIQSAITY